MSTQKKIISLIFKFIVTISSTLGVILCLRSSDGSFMGGATTLLYFTIQSNIWIALTCLACAIKMIVEIKNKREINNEFLNAIKLIFTVSITLTGIVFCTMIAPFSGKGAWALTNVLTHVIAPIFSILDFVLFDYQPEYTYKKALLSAIPPLYYLVFSLIGFFANWNFGAGKNYPYAFLNYAGSAGVFGFSTNTKDSLFLGSFYWIIILVIFVISVSFLYTFIARKQKSKLVAKQSKTQNDSNSNVA